MKKNNPHTDKEKKVLVLLLRLILIILFYVLIGWLLDNYIGRVAMWIWVVIILALNIKTLADLS